MQMSNHRAVQESNTADDISVLYGKTPSCDFKDDNNTHNLENYNCNLRDLLKKHEDGFKPNIFKYYIIAELLSMKKDVEECYGKGAFSQYIGKEIFKLLGLSDIHAAVGEDTK